MVNVGGYVLRRALLPLAMALLSCRAEPERVQERGAVRGKDWNIAAATSDILTPLRGEGSEVIRLPRGAELRRSPQGTEVWLEGQPFLEVLWRSPELSEIRNSGPPVAHENASTVVFSQEERYAAVVVKDLVPEWDPTDTRRVRCQSPKVGEWPDAAWFSKDRLALVLSACASLALPALQ